MPYPTSTYSERYYTTHSRGGCLRKLGAAVGFYLCTLCVIADPSLFTAMMRVCDASQISIWLVIVLCVSYIHTFNRIMAWYLKYWDIAVDANRRPVGDFRYMFFDAWSVALVASISLWCDVDVRLVASLDVLALMVIAGVITAHRELPPSGTRVETEHLSGDGEENV